jgi:hypothetical protein
MAKIRNASLEKLAAELRSTLQNLLREKVRTLKEREELAAAIKRSRSHVESMLYEGKGGLDSWVKAFAYCFELSAAAIKKIKIENLAKTELDEADRIWFQLRDTLKANHSDRYYYARIAYAAYEIKQELEQSQNKGKRK